MTPLLGYSEDGQIVAFRTRHGGVQIYTVSVDEMREVPSIDAAEDHFFDLAARISVDHRTVGEHMRNAADPATFMLPCEMRRQGSYIARDTRRGRANRVFMSHRMFDHLIGLSMTMISEPTGTVGRWYHAGTMREIGSIFVGDHMPDNEIIIAYRGPSDRLSDGAGGVTEIGSALFMYENHGEYATAGDYLRRLVVTYKF